MNIIFCSIPAYTNQNNNNNKKNNAQKKGEIYFNLLKK